MCNMNDCAETITVVAVPEGGGKAQYVCERCSVALDETEMAFDMIDLGAWAVGQEIGQDPLKVMEVKVALDKSYADVLSELLANPVK